MERRPKRLPAPLTLGLAALLIPPAGSFAQEPTPTREFEIRDDRAYLGGEEVDLWGLRCGNALYSRTVTERHVRALDTMIAHGINCIGVYIQGSNGGWPDGGAGLNGFTRDGRLKPDVAERLEWLVREADARGMVVMVGLCSPRKDHEFYDDAAIRRAVEEAGRFLTERKLKNVFTDIMHEYDHDERIDKKMTQKQDSYENDGVFTPGEKAFIFADCERFLEAPNAVMLLHSGYCMGLTNGSGTAPHPEMGGYGDHGDDRGIRFYYEWVRDNVGRWEYPHHVRDDHRAPGRTLS